MVPERQRPLVDIATDIMADENQRIGISFTRFCLTSLPHKRLPDEQIWEKKGHHVTLWVEPGLTADSAEQARMALRPDDPSALRVQVPQEPKRVSDGVQTDLNVMFRNCSPR
jgi:hypothetical protein